MEPFKNSLNIHVITACANLIQNSYPAFSKEKFLQSFTTLDSLELKERCNLIAERLDEYMPEDFNICQKIIFDNLTPPNILLVDNDKKYFSGFVLWAIQMFFIRRINKYSSHLVDIVHLLKEITSRSSSEFSIRYLIQSHFDIVHPLLLSLLDHENHHIRRWISEGTRPRLPWGIKLNVFCLNPELNAPIIKALQADESLYVRKSVANHLNDISKDNPQFVIDWVNSHLKEAQENPLLFWTFKHGLRTLIKKGNISALKILGIDDKVQYTNFVSNVHYDNIKKDSQSHQIVNITFNSLTSSKTILDFRLRYPGSNSNGYKNKVIKGKTFDSIIGVNNFAKKINLFDNSVSTFNPGDYLLEIIVNGKKVDEVTWRLIK